MANGITTNSAAAPLVLSRRACSGLASCFVLRNPGTDACASFPNGKGNLQLKHSKLHAFHDGGEFVGKLFSFLHLCTGLARTRSSR